MLLTTGAATPPASFSSPGKIRQTVYNVKDYGAVGNGSTDDTTAIQAALDAANTAGGGTVFIPQATFIASNLKIHGKTTLMGTGEGSVLKFKSSSTGNFLTLNTPSAEVNVTLYNLKFDGNSTGSDVIYFDNTSVAQDSMHRIEHVYVFNAGQDGVHLGPAVVETNLISIYVHNSARYGFNFDVGATDNRIISCSSGLSANHAFYIQGNNNHFTDCKSYYAGYTGSAWTAGVHGFVAQPSASQDLHVLSFVGCESQNNATDAFHFDASASSATINHISVVNCMADGNNEAAGTGVAFYCYGTQGMSFTNNTVRQQSGANHIYGVALYGNQNGTKISSANDLVGSTASLYIDSGVSNYGNAVNVPPLSVADSTGVGGIDQPFGTVAAHTAVQRFISFNGVQQYVAKYGAADWYVNNSTSTSEVNALTVAYDHIDIHSLPLHNVLDPTSAQDAATKNYADIKGWQTAPSTATSTGTAGQRAYDGSYLYICTATNTWRRVAIASW